MMKNVMVLFLIFFLFTITTFGQTPIYLRLYANMGLQLNSFKNPFNTDIYTNSSAFQLGAGSNYKFGKFLIGTSFYNANGEVKNEDFRMETREFISTLYLGYDLLKSTNVALEPSLGFFMGNKQSVVYDLQNSRTNAYEINQLGISPSLTFSKFNPMGVSTALKIGMNHPVSRRPWIEGFAHTPTPFSSNTSTLFIQLNMGGRINLKKQVKMPDLTQRQIIESALNPYPINQLIIKDGAVQLNTKVFPKQNSETIILLHGGPGVPNEMNQVANLLSKKYQVIYFEQRGTGNSNCSKCSYSMEDYISDIEAIAAHFKLESFHLFGHSWGGLYAQIYADKNPQKIKSLFLCSPSSGTNIIWKETEREVMSYNRSVTTNAEWIRMGWLSLIGMLGSSKSYRKLFKQVYKNYHQGFDTVEVSEAELLGVYAAPINKTRKEIIRYKILPKMESSKFPIYITFGAKDIYGKSNTHLLERYPNAKIFTIKNCGHIPWLHNSNAFDDIIINCFML